MLDRGEFKDWFGSTEIIVYAVLCGLGFYLFLVHTLTANAPLIPPRIFRDVNFVSRAADDLPGRHADLGHCGTARALSADAGRPLGRQHRPPAGPSRRRHHDRRVRRGTSGQSHRPEMDDGRWHSARRSNAMGDDGLDAGHRRVVDFPQLDDPGLRPRHCLHAVAGRCLRDPSGRLADGWHLVVQPASQRGPRDRRFGDLRHAHRRTPRSCIPRLPRI